MTTEVGQALWRLRRMQPRNPDTMLVCDELERLIGAHNKTGRATFDRNAYQKEYMRRRRERERAVRNAVAATTSGEQE